jgi:hypothetical protein
VSIKKEQHTTIQKAILLRDMKELRDFTEKVIHFAQSKGASYADVRVVPFENREEILVKNGRVNKTPLTHFYQV